MTRYIENIRAQLTKSPLPAAQLLKKLGISQPTMSRTLAKLGNEIVTFGAARSIHYALRDNRRGLSEIPIYRVNAEGLLRQLGTLSLVCPDGFVMRQGDGKTLYSDGLPWWLYDMRPQGFLGRAYVARHGAGLFLPNKLNEWTDTHVLHALLMHGHDMVGNVLVGDNARGRFLAATMPKPILASRKPKDYARLALEAARGEMPGSSAGGEQPKFTAYAMAEDGARHVIVKFTEQEESPISERWRDLLLIEHLALETLRESGFSAAKTQIIDHEGQRFLEIERFDRVGSHGRRALHSLSSLDAEFVGMGMSGWPDIVRELANGNHIRPEAVDGAHLLYAFGTLIGNSDMHNGNLSFIAEYGRPYSLAPAYDMTAMAFAPRSGGGLPDTLPAASIISSVPNETWLHAETLARAFMGRVREAEGFSNRFAVCIDAMEKHLESASAMIAKLEVRNDAQDEPSYQMGLG